MDGVLIICLDYLFIAWFSYQSEDGMKPFAMLCIFFFECMNAIFLKFVCLLYGMIRVLGSDFDYEERLGSILLFRALIDRVRYG